MKKLSYYIMENGELNKMETTAETTYEILKGALNDVTLGVISIHPKIDIWYDDEFLFKDTFEPTLLIKNSDTQQLTDFDVLLQGRILFASHDEEGDTVDFPYGYTDWLISNLQLVSINGKPTYLFKNF